MLDGDLRMLDTDNSDGLPARDDGHGGIGPHRPARNLVGRGVGSRRGRRGIRRPEVAVQAEQARCAPVSSWRRSVDHILGNAGTGPPRGVRSPTNRPPVTSTGRPSGKPPGSDGRNPPRIHVAVPRPPDPAPQPGAGETCGTAGSVRLSHGGNLDGAVETDTRPPRSPE